MKNFRYCSIDGEEYTVSGWVPFSDGCEAFICTVVDTEAEAIQERDRMNRLPVARLACPPENYKVQEIKQQGA